MVFAQKSQTRAECLIALSEIDFLDKRRMPAIVSPEQGFEWQWDGTEISLMKVPGKRSMRREPVWNAKSNRESGDGRIAAKYLRDQKLPSKNLADIQAEFLRHSFITLQKTTPTAQNAIELDAIYSNCETVDDVVPPKYKQSVGSLAIDARAKIRSQFPQIFKSSGSSGGTAPRGGAK